MRHGLHIVVTGGRHYDRRDRVFQALDELHAATPIAMVAHGACGVAPERSIGYPMLREEYANRPGEIASRAPARAGMTGADRWADEWAIERGVWVGRWFAQWVAEGNAAGAIRNTRMLDEAKPDVVVAFPGRVGTADCMQKARKLGIRVVEIDAPPPAQSGLFA